MIIVAAKIIGLGIASIGVIGAGIGIGTVFGCYLIALSRNPLLKGELFSIMLLGFALVEATALFALMFAFLKSKIKFMFNSIYIKCYSYIYILIKWITFIGVIWLYIYILGNTNYLMCMVLCLPSLKLKDILLYYIVLMNSISIFTILVSGIIMAYSINVVYSEGWNAWSKHLEVIGVLLFCVNITNVLLMILGFFYIWIAYYFFIVIPTFNCIYWIVYHVRTATSSDKIYWNGQFSGSEILFPYYDSLWFKYRTINSSIWVYTILEYWERPFYKLFTISFFTGSDLYFYKMKNFKLNKYFIYLLSSISLILLAIFFWKLLIIKRAKKIIVNSTFNNTLYTESNNIPIPKNFILLSRKTKQQWKIVSDRLRGFNSFSVGSKYKCIFSAYQNTEGSFPLGKKKHWIFGHVNGTISYSICTNLDLYKSDQISLRYLRLYGPSLLLKGDKRGHNLSFYLCVLPINIRKLQQNKNVWYDSPVSWNNWYQLMGMLKNYTKSKK